MDDHFQNIFPSVLHLLKCLFGFLKLIPVCDEFLRLHPTTRHEINGGRVHSSLVSDGSPNREISDAGGGDREDDVLTRLSAQIKCSTVSAYLASHASLNEHAALLAKLNASLYGTLSSSGIYHYIRTVS